MQTHHRKLLDGPVSGSRPWWRAPEPLDITPTNDHKKEPMFRAALVDQIRREIAKGTYDIPERWDAALDRLLDRLAGEDA